MNFIPNNDYEMETSVNEQVHWAVKLSNSQITWQDREKRPGNFNLSPSSEYPKEL